MPNTARHPISRQARPALNLIEDPDNTRPPWLGDLSQLPAPAQQWVRLPGLFARYVCAAFPGVEIRHCGHPTALRPYYFVGLATARKVRLLRDAKACVEAVHNGLIDAANL